MHNLNIVPFAVRPKVGAALAGIGLTEFYRRLKDPSYGYVSFLDGTARFVTVESIRAHQQRQLEATGGTPQAKPSKRCGGPGRPKSNHAPPV
jgi:hypothetical protein